MYKTHMLICYNMYMFQTYDDAYVMIIKKSGFDDHVRFKFNYNNCFTDQGRGSG